MEGVSLASKAETRTIEKLGSHWGRDLCTAFSPLIGSGFKSKLIPFQIRSYPSESRSRRKFDAKYF
jgi:hypothetical protein